MTDMPDLAVKFAKGSDSLVEGLAIPYGGPFGGKDLDGEFFSKNTDFCLDWFEVRPTIYDHGLDDGIKAVVVGKVAGYESTDAGVWAQVQLGRNHQYLAAIQELVQQRALAFSSGAMPHLVQKDRKSGEITRWPWVELSLTPTPANPDAIVYAVKSSQMLAHMAALEDGSLESGETYADNLVRVLDEVKALTDRSQGRVLLRSKVGRVLSAANRERLSTLRDRIAESSSHAATVLKDLDELLKTTDPEADKRAALAEFERFRAIAN